MFVGSTPQMWDSRHDDGQPVPTADEPGNTTHVQLNVTPADNGGALVTITPDPVALTGKDVVYPVYIDPTTGDIRATDWGDVADNGFTNYRDDFFARVGRCYKFAECNGNRNWVARSFFVMPTTALQARNGYTAVLRSATFTITNAHTGDNGCNPVQAFYNGSQFTSATRWPGPDLGTDMDIPQNACKGASVLFNAIGAAQTAVNFNSSQITIGLKSVVAEGTQDGHHWNRFDSGSAAFAVRFAFPPGPATNQGISKAVTCTGQPITSDAYPTLSATATDNNIPVLNILLYFEVWTADETTHITTSPPIQVASGTTGQWQVNVNLGNGDYGYRVAVKNTGGDGTGEIWNGTFSPWTKFQTRATPPAKPTLDSRDYPPNYWGHGAGTFYFKTNPNDYTTAGWAYSFTGPGTVKVPNTNDCNYNQTFPNGGWVARKPITTGAGTNAQVIPANFPPGYHTVHVRAFDRAHNLSAEETAYVFYVAPSYGVTTRLNTGDPTQVAVTQPAGQNIPITQEDGRLHFDGTAAGQSFSMAFTAPLEADYALGVRIASGLVPGNRNNVTVTVDDVPKPLIPAGQIYGALGGVHLTKGQHVITLSTTGSHTGGGLDPFDVTITGIDAIPLNNVTTNSFTEAMDNDGISNDGTTVSADKSLDFDGGALSAQTLAAAGLAPGASLTVQGSTFTLPTPNSAGFDNVVAIGQTIPLPAAHQVPSTAIGFLVASTCGETPATTVGITYTDGTTEQPALASITDWAKPSQGVATPVATLPYRNVGATKDTVNKPTVYTVFIPANPLKTPQKITLPNLGTAFRRTCVDSAALHVLAMAPRPVTPPDGKTWAGAWTAPADTTTPPPTGGFANKTLRIIAHPSITGSEARIRLSNTGSPTPVTIAAATIAAHTTGAATTTPTTLKFNGNTTVTIPAGGDAYSDPVALPTGGSGNLAISLHIPNTVTTTPVHTANGTTTYLASGNATTNPDAAAYTTTLPSTYYLTGLDVTTTASNGTIAILADQNTRAPDTHTSWGDTLATQLGNQLPGGLVTTTHTTPPPPGWWTALNQTTLAGPRLRTVIVTLGAQDILNGDTPQNTTSKLTQLIDDINGYNRYKRPDGTRIRVILSTIAPLGLDPNSTQEKNRQQLNADIIRRYGQYGANELINLDQALRDSANPANINPTYLTNDVPNDTYYQRITQTFHTGITNGTITF
ncbi:hypothetical protein ALI144C_01780 [Actinosynnema sp. ALI-1.44]|nr:hypothetical protein ALI144C_01780 [Actinosynnema sp. ALI-1.44]